MHGKELLRNHAQEQATQRRGKEVQRTARRRRGSIAGGVQQRRGHCARSSAHAYSLRLTQASSATIDAGDLWKSGVKCMAGR
ncbi:hypothetical protein AXF42_Ash001981 [Apostasia shenzhenica]|uniref:Uncharacterized protein n=1 Tax=Apostasia shenzhenica TaxID=1088818 RepID=A0A2I0ABS9_9ASPA|nr:hypothetical protein AXF42_Ash001981 [Apostasia shenzhenica]